MICYNGKTKMDLKREGKRLDSFMMAALFDKNGNLSSLDPNAFMIKLDDVGINGNFERNLMR